MKSPNTSRSASFSKPFSGPLITLLSRSLTASQSTSQTALLTTSQTASLPASLTASPSTPLSQPNGLRRSGGFTLIEVLVALSIVAVALAAGTQAMQALTSNAARQSDVLLGQLCAENELVKIRLARQMPSVGDATVLCEQAGRTLQVLLTVRPTPNPQFRRVDAKVSDAGAPIVQLSTVVTQY